MNEKLPLVTIVTPSYNQGCFIEETILSVLNQDYPNIEYLVIDGGSTDNTIDILRKYEDRLFWISEPDRGQSHAINKGFQLARGEILCWLNSDDFFEPRAITVAVDKFIQDADVMMVYGDGNLVNEKGELISLFPYTRSFDLWALTYQLDYILQPSTFFRKVAVQQVDYLNEDLHWCMDWDLWIRIGSRNLVEYIPHCLANARIYGSNKSATGGLKRFMEIVSVLNAHCHKVILPAYIIYGFATITTYIHSTSFKWYRFLKRLLNPIRILLWAFASNAQGVYQDGWLGRKAKFLFASGINADTIFFEFDVPDNEFIFPNELSITVNGREMQRQFLTTAGVTELCIPYDRSLADITKVTLNFKNSLPWDSNLRRLACRLKQVKLINLSQVRGLVWYK